MMATISGAFSPVRPEFPPRQAGSTRRDPRRVAPGILARLEAAAGPDRGLDIAIARLLGLVDGDAAQPCCADGSPVPRFTASREEVEACLARRLPGWRWSVEESPHPDAQLWRVAGGSGHAAAGPDHRVSAWKERDGHTHMEWPPANVAIALTLVLLRAWMRHPG